MIGQRLGPWMIEAEIGRGAMGCVYRARRTADGPDMPEIAALKVLNADLARDAVFLGRFQREIAALEQLNHPNIVRFYEAGSADGVFYYAMEYVPGPDFQAILAERGRLPWRAVLDVAMQVVPALKHAHDRGIIHRDLKPANVLLNEAATEDTGDTEEDTANSVFSVASVVKITDFGVAKLFAQPALTSTGNFVGTAAYLAPEQAVGKPATKRTDLYSLGGVLYTLLTGRTPFSGDNVAELMHKHCYQIPERPQRLVPEIPHDVDALVMQLLEKDPARRPADGLVLLRQIERLRGKYDRKQQNELTEHANGAAADAYPTAVQMSSKSGSAEVLGDRPSGVSATAGPATIMAGLMRSELREMNKGGPMTRFFNHPLVLLAMLAACVGLIVYGFSRKRLGPDELFAQAQPLMESDNPANWRRAWTDYLEPLEERFGNHAHKDEVRVFRQKMLDAGDLDKALERAKVEAPKSEAERFYRQGLTYRQNGDVNGARRVWQNLVAAFAGVPAEERWVKLAERGLEGLATPAKPPPRQSLREALAAARRLNDAGKTDEARRIWDALDALYRDDPAGADALDEIKRARDH